MKSDVRVTRIVMVLGWVAYLILAILLYSSAWAGEPKHTPSKRTGPPDIQLQGQGQGQGQEQSQQQYQSQDQYMNQEQSANNEGNELSVSSTYEAPAPDIVLVPNNNTESCLRVWGIGGSWMTGSTVLGIPYRSTQCDLEQAADDASARGDHAQADFWRCHKKNVYKQFKNQNRRGKNSLIMACLDQTGVFRDTHAEITTLRKKNTELTNRTNRAEKELSVKRMEEKLSK